MSIENPDANGSNSGGHASSGLPPELQAFFNAKSSQLTQGAQNAQRAIPNKVIRGDGTELDPSNRNGHYNNQPLQNVHPERNGSEAPRSPTPQPAPVAATVATEDPVIEKDPFDFNEPKIPPAPTEEVDPYLDTEEVPPPDKIAENFKKFRKITKASKEAAAAAQKKAEELEAKIKEYNEGVHIPERLQALEDENARLTTYEKLHSLKTSREYVEAFVEPLNSLQSKLTELAIDYELPKGLIESGLNITNRRELNQFLSSHFDDAGAAEVRAVYEKVRSIQSAAREAELQPAQALKEMQENGEARKREEAARRASRISDQTRNAWVKVVTQLRQEGTHPEISHRETDPEHNKNANKLLSTASSDFGKLVKALVDNGLQQLPEELGQYFAKMTILGHNSVINAMTRDRFAAEAERLERQIRETNQFIRPITTRGGTQGPPSSNGQEKPLSPKDAANEALRIAGVRV